MFDSCLSRFVQRVVYVRNAKSQAMRDLSVSNYLVHTTKSGFTCNGLMPTILRDAKGRMFIMGFGARSVMGLSWQQ